VLYAQNVYTALSVFGVNMKKVVIFGAAVLALGLLIALGPQFLFKVCGQTMVSTVVGEIADCCAVPEENGCCAPAVSSLPICHWSARAEIGIGLLIAALGACIIVFPDPKTQLGLLIGVFMASLIALAIPHALIGGCGLMAMTCRRVAFPALTVESVILLVFSAIMVVMSAMQKQVGAE
jgi:hypothetical protein